MGTVEVQGREFNLRAPSGKSIRILGITIVNYFKFLSPMCVSVLLALRRARTKIKSLAHLILPIATIRDVARCPRRKVGVAATTTADLSNGYCLFAPRDYREFMERFSFAI